MFRYVQMVDFFFEAFLSAWLAFDILAPFNHTLLSAVHISLPYYRRAE